MATDYENNYVKKSYELISDEFDKSRYNVWPSVKQFLDKLNSNDLVLEVGCGNGKNMLYRKDLNMHGIDFTDSLIEICKSKNLNVTNANCLSIPFKDNTFDSVISIAVIHHLDSHERRTKAISEILRVTKPNGKVIIQVWAFKQPEKSKRQFEKKGDNIVLWKKKDNEQVQRYYYIFDDDELKNIVEELGIKEYKYYYDFGNWVIEFIKSF